MSDRGQTSSDPTAPYGPSDSSPAGERRWLPAAAAGGVVALILAGFALYSLLGGDDDDPGLEQVLELEDALEILDSMIDEAGDTEVRGAPNEPLTEQVDIDGDGKPETAIDTDGDGVVDTPAIDTDGDGVADTPDENPVTPIGHPPAEVRVLVADGSTVAGAAADASDLLSARNYAVLTSESVVEVETTTIYFEPDYEADAYLIAEALLALPNQVQPLPVTDPHGIDTKSADVLVVLGGD